MAVEREDERMKTTEELAAEHAGVDLRIHLARMLDTTSLSPSERARAAQNSEWIQHLHATIKDSIERDADRQWSILRLFVPLSLAPFVAIGTGDSVTLAQVAALGLASVTLIACANLLTARISDFLVDSWAWLRAIEAETGIPELAEPVHTSRWIRITTIRWALLPLIAAMWVIVGAVSLA